MSGKIQIRFVNHVWAFQLSIMEITEEMVGKQYGNKTHNNVTENKQQNKNKTLKYF